MIVLIMGVHQHNATRYGMDEIYQQNVMVGSAIMIHGVQRAAFSVSPTSYDTTPIRYKLDKGQRDTL